MPDRPWGRRMNCRTAHPSSRRRSVLVIGWMITWIFSPCVATATESPLALAQRYEHGEGVDIDLAKALALYCEAADHGDADAAYHIGWIYFTGRVLPQNNDLAAGWFATAASRGQVQARNILQRFHLAASDAHVQCAPPKPNVVTADVHPPAEIAKRVNAGAAQLGLDPKLVLALIQVESAFQPLAQSSKGAHGLMQLMPETAERFGVTNITDVTQNLTGGMKYLRWLLSYFEGNVTLALAAYNAGEENVLKYHGVPPFPETRQYIQRIRVYYAAERHRYDPQFAKSARLLSPFDVIPPASDAGT